MEYHDHVEHQGHSLESSNLSGTKDHLPHGLSDNETGDKDASKEDEEEEKEEDKDHVATSPPCHPSDSNFPSHERSDQERIKHQNVHVTKGKSKHGDIPASSAFIDVPLKDGNIIQDDTDQKKVHRPLLFTKEDDTCGNIRSSNTEGEDLKDMPLEDSAGEEVHASLNSEKNTGLLSSKGAALHNISSTSDHKAPDFSNSFLLRSCLTTGPHLGIPHLPHIATAGIPPQTPLFMLPRLAQPFLMLPQHMPQPQWPIFPLQSAPRKIPMSETDFVPFSALTADTIASPSHKDEAKDVKKKHTKVGRKHKKTEDVVNTNANVQDLGHIRYKTEYRKTNRASRMLLCDKVKLPHKKPSKRLNLVDISDGVSGESSSMGNSNMPVAKLVTSQMIQESLSLNAGNKLKPGKGKKKTTTSSKTAGAKKAKKGKTGVSKKIKVDGANQKYQGELKLKKGKRSGVKKQLTQVKSQQSMDDAMLPRPRVKKKVQLSPEKMLYNKLTQVVKQIAEPNIFSPITLPPDLEIKCSYCDVIYPDRKTLWDHIQSHLKKPVPFRLSKYYRFCKICRKYVSEIRDHIRAVHFDGGTPYGCPKCQEKFRYKGLLRNHIQNRHTTARNYMCEVCGLAFKQSVTLRKHKMVHTDEKNFFCATCGKAFKTMYALQKHVVVHAVVKPFRCKICNKEFTQQTNMKSHMRTHTGEKPYRCDLCPMAFTHNVSLKTHKKKQHGIDMWKDPTHSQTSKLVASSAPNIKMAIKFIDEMSNQAVSGKDVGSESNEISEKIEDDKAAEDKTKDNI